MKECKTVSTSLCMYFLLTLLFSIPFSAVLAGLGIKADLSIQLLSILTTICVIPILIKRYTRKLEITIPFDKHLNLSFSKVLYYTLISIGSSMILGILTNLINLLLLQFDLQMTMPDLSFKNDAFYNMIIILSVCVIAPVFEELFFRGFILQALKRHGNVFAIITTSILFALLHGNLVQAIPVFALSIVISYSVIRTNNVLIGILIHFLNNSLSIFELFFVKNVVISAIFLLVSIGFIIFTISTIIKKRTMILNYYHLYKGKNITYFFKNWVSIVFLVLTLLMTATSFIKI
ncbi:CPBP family intramembrane glutamic endopeptidase [Amedibacterium intestinale]|uniref:CPBP family intramembrane glutamic endopeptidase n=1 Tax=Amedibacterium intestinale TaxID=2583452 RepID=UPI0013D22503|nr:type II CAAX endopeptidase family protein [Amedibacterium intestinale]